MPKHWRKRKRSVVFSQFFLSYLLILLLPFAVFSFLIISMMHEMKESSLRESEYVLQSVSDDINHKMDSIYSSILSLNYNAVIHDLLSSPDSHRNIVEALSVTKEIASLEKNEDVIYIYLEDQEVLLSSKGIYSGLSKIYGNIISYGDMDYREFHDKVLNADSPNMFLPSAEVRADSRDYSAILYLKRIPFGGKTGKSATALCFIDSSHIDNRIRSYVGEDNRWFCAFTKDGDMIYSTDNDPGDVDSFVEQYRDSGILPDKNGKGYDKDGNIYTVKQVDFNGWVLVSGIDKTDLYKQAGKVQIIMIALFAVYAVIGCYLAYYISNRNMQPLKRILGLWNYNGGGTEKRVNEYEALESCFQDIITQNKELEHTKYDYMAKMRKVGIQNLICGKYNTLEEIAEAEMPEITGSRFFQVMLLDFSPELLLADDRTIDSFNIRRHVMEKLILQLSLKQVIISEINIYQLGLLFYTDDEPEMFEKELKEYADKILMYLKDHVEGNLSIGRGGVAEGARRVGYSFIQAECAVRACQEYKKDQMAYDSIPRKYEKYYFPSQLREMLLGAVSDGNLKQAKGILKVLNVENFEIRQLSKTQEGQFIDEMHSIMLHLKNSDMIQDKQVEPKEPVQGQDLFYYYTQKIMGVCSRRTEQAFTQKERMQQELLEFIDGHYMDNNLCLSMLASSFKLSESYLSYLFKKNYGVNFSAYLENKRIEQARLLLIQGGRSVEEVCRLVGYNSAHVFRRAFRKVTGSNPSDIARMRK